MSVSREDLAELGITEIIEVAAHPSEDCDGMRYCPESLVEALKKYCC